MTRNAISYLRRNPIAYLALFLSLSGTALAARPMISGADIQDDSVTAADVREESLASVPRAGDADRVGGIAAGALLRVVRSERLTRDYPTIAPGTCYIDGFHDDTSPEESSVLVNAVAYVDTSLVFTGDSVGLLAGETRGAYFRVCNTGPDPVDPPQMTVRVRIVE